MDWTLCIICQQTTSEHVKCPLNAPGSGYKSVPYESFFNRANAFRELNQLPVPLAEGITLNDLTMNKGVWCHFKFSQDRERANRKRLIRNGDEHAGIKRAHPQRLSPEKNV